MTELHRIFGQLREVPLTYVERDNIDLRFASALASRKQIALHGNSKQGKTTLRLKHAIEAVTVSCTTRTTKVALYQAVLDELDQPASDTTRVTVRREDDGSITGGLQVPGLGTGISGTKNTRSGYEREVVTSHQQGNLEDANYLALRLRRAGLTRPIAIEDFHLASETVQREVAADLKVLYDRTQIPFIIIGVWAEPYRLDGLTGDLAFRLENIDANRWTPNQLTEIIRKGARLLNISIQEGIERKIVDSCGLNVGVLHEILFKLCLYEKVHSRQPTRRVVGTVSLIDRLVSKIARAGELHFSDSLHKLVGELRTSDSGDASQIVRMILQSSRAQLREGIPSLIIAQHLARRDKNGKLQTSPDRVRDILRSFSELQNKLQILPPIFEFFADRLAVIDDRFLLFHDLMKPEKLLVELGLVAPTARSLRQARRQVVCRACGAWEAPGGLDAVSARKELERHQAEDCEATLGSGD